jgi:hypothetical protein
MAKETPLKGTHQCFTCEDWAKQNIPLTTSLQLPLGPAGGQSAEEQEEEAEEYDGDRNKNRGTSHTKASGEPAGFHRGVDVSALCKRVASSVAAAEGKPGIGTNGLACLLQYDLPELVGTQVWSPRTRARAHTSR